MSTESIYQALITQLKTVTGLPPLQTENTTMQAKGSFSRATVIRSRPDTLTVGVTGRDLHTAILQVDVFVPLNIGSEAANALADAVIAAFPRGLELTADGDVIHIIKAYRATALRLNDAFHHIPVSVEHRVVI
jgi:hypothetical protein